MGDSIDNNSKISPELRERLLNESKNPWKGLRRSLWIISFASSFLGILIMGTQFLSGKVVTIQNIGIQLIAVLIFGGLIYFDREK